MCTSVQHTVTHYPLVGGAELITSAGLLTPAGPLQVQVLGASNAHTLNTARAP